MSGCVAEASAGAAGTWAGTGNGSSQLELSGDLQHSAPLQRPYLAAA